MKPDTILDLIEHQKEEKEDFLKWSIKNKFKNLVRIYGYKYFLNEIEFYQITDEEYIKSMKAKLEDMGWATQIKQIDRDCFALYIQIPQGKQ
jgi:hypothetical protein